MIIGYALCTLCSPRASRLSSVRSPDPTLLPHLGSQREQRGVNLGHGDGQQETDALGQPSTAFLRDDRECKFSDHSCNKWCNLIGQTEVSINYFVLNHVETY